MHMLIAVASKHGSTRGIADAIAAVLRAANIMTDVQSAGEVTTLAPYDAVILGSAVYAGSWLPDAKHFAAQHGAALATRPLWVFSSGPVGDENPQPRDNPATLATALGGIPIREHKVFVGKLDADELSFAERMIARVVNAPMGDFRDWEVIHEWAHTIADALAAPATP